jgi:hypothetical protein
MENTHPFSLKKSVSDWKQSLLARNLISAEEAAELESHLSDSINQLVATGLNEEEAFLVSTHRMGHPCKLEQEFAKVHTNRQWKQKLIWMLVGWVLLLFVEQLGRIAIGAGFAGLYLNWNVTTASFAAAAANIAIWTIGIGALLWIAKNPRKPLLSRHEKQGTIPLKSWILLAIIAYALVFLGSFLIMNIGQHYFGDALIGEMYFYYGFTKTFGPLFITIICVLGIGILKKSSEPAVRNGYR